jgi:hypothetical protein
MKLDYINDTLAAAASGNPVLSARMEDMLLERAEVAALPAPGAESLAETPVGLHYLVLRNT